MEKPRPGYGRIKEVRVAVEQGVLEAVIHSFPISAPLLVKLVTKPVTKGDKLNSLSYHAFMQSCRMKENAMQVKTVGKSGQISLGKAMAGMGFIMEEMPGGNIMLKRAVVVPLNESWAHEPEMRAKLTQADAWMCENSAAETNLDQLEAKLDK